MFYKGSEPEGDKKTPGALQLLNVGGFYVRRRQKSLPVDNDNVTISSPVLVDTALPDLFSITIQNGGKLVFSRFDNHDLSVHYILIDDGGEMHIGSEDCQFEKYVTISLLGEPDEPIDIPGFGQKFIGVRENGVLELHGKDKLSWTKVSKTVSQTDPDQLVKFSHLEKDDVMKAPGLNIYRFQKDGTVIDSIHEPISRNQNKVNQAIARMEVFMDGIQNGDVVAIATQGEVIRKASLDLSGLVSKFDEVLGAHSLGDVVKGSAYAYIGILGDDASVDEDLQFENNKRAHASVTLKLDQFNTRFTVHSVNHKRGRKFADFVVTDVQEEEPIIEVVDDASSWTKGDRVFITSTDYDWKQVEEFTLLDCPQCSVNQIKLNEPIANTHFGEIYKNVDMRAEVGLMSRHIIIQGIVTRGNSNGGHVKILDNVCYNTFGHGFFIEDGGEKYTHIEGNLGLGQKSWKGLIGQVGTTGTIPTDKTPVTFWITNPLQILKNNVAAGGDGVGMWFVYPDEPTGPSRNLSLMADKEARHTPVEEFYNNVAHSYIKAGLFVDNIEQDDLTVKGYNQYDPREVPTDFNSQRVPAIFTRLTGINIYLLQILVYILSIAFFGYSCVFFIVRVCLCSWTYTLYISAYKNRRQNAWIRGGWMVLRRAS
ncbi:hypothetical protein FSP39_015947 [Pinctada imbricata]|uniref:G8 domain-containing protein n=1 Tax=Pinctada imbricata TaxID=66713 RepID=A0AA89C7S2_PINIB|nr:hypothetical protein FSP39_015947 [Pinctada imbricata]